MNFLFGETVLSFFYLSFRSFFLLTFIIVLPIIWLSGCGHTGHSCDQFLGTAEYTPCLASKGDQDAQYKMGRAAYEEGDIDEAVKWLKQAAKKRDGRIPIFIPEGSGGDVRIEMRESGLSKPGHKGSKRLLERINSES